MNRNKIMLALAAAALLLVPVSAFAADTPDATLTMEGTTGGIGIGFGGGSGVLTYKGYDIPFEFSNFNVGKIGVTTAKAEGQVNNLSFLEKFNGCYSGSDVDANLGSSGLTQRVKNKGGVTIDLKGKEKGVDISISKGCSTITMDPEKLAEVLAALKAQPVPADYQSSIFFDTDSDNIRKSENTKLDSVITALEKTPGTEVIVTGFTDTTGPEMHNQTLSEQRAQAVLEALTQRAENTVISQLPPERVAVRGRGEVEGPKGQADQKNRRVDILIISPSKSQS